MSKNKVSIVEPGSELYISPDDLQVVCLSSLMSLAHSCTCLSDFINQHSFFDVPFDDVYYKFYKRVKFLDRDLSRYLKDLKRG